ncbi:universal stress protein [Dehalogenimonas sp. THU2]|uniref:universal stress protein n=1 Tax=Dehalogenimonas sp. THU2 TaxID=3151121 RepID=UPI00321867A1
MEYRKILVPLDGSESAEQALPLAKALAGKNTNIVLFSVCPEDELRLCRLNSAYLDVQAKALTAEGLQSVICHTEPGDLADRIKNYTAREGVELVIVCRQGYSDLSREEKVLQNLVTDNSSLLLVKPDAAKPRLSRILLPLDGSIISEGAVPHVIKLAKAAGLEVLLLSVNGFPEIPSDRPPAAKPSWEEYALVLMKEVREQASGYLDRQAQDFRQAGLKVKTQVVFGSVAESILKVSEEEHVDVIAMATHRRSGLDRWVYGSVAATVSAATELPMLLVRGSENR